MKHITFDKNSPVQLCTIFSALLMGCSVANATVVSEFSDPANNWKLVADGYRTAGIAAGEVVGGDAFDAEYLFYKQSGSRISIGLQSGFNLVTGVQDDGYDTSHTFHAGDLALSFDGDSSNYEYAFDFGARSDGFWAYDQIVGTDRELIDAHTPGFYKVNEWGNQVFPTRTDAVPYAMKDGVLLSVDSGMSNFGYDTTLASYWRVYSFDIQQFIDHMHSTDPTFSFGGVDIHWTMSCGNDAIDGSAPVPEPATMLLFGTGLAGLAAIRRRGIKQS